MEKEFESELYNIEERKLALREKNSRSLMAYSYILPSLVLGFIQTLFPKYSPPEWFVWTVSVMAGISVIHFFSKEVNLLTSFIFKWFKK